MKLNTRRVLSLVMIAAFALTLVACKPGKNPSYLDEINRDATYNISFSKTQNLNPLTSSDSAASDVFDFLKAPLYGTDYDWYTAINEGNAKAVGDFSKVESGEVNIEEFSYKYTLDNAAKYPLSVTKNTDYTNKDGEVMKDESKASLDTVWRVTLKDNLIFEDGTAINADTYEYTLKQYLDPKQLNFRADNIYDSDYLNLKNSYAYYMQGRSKSGSEQVYPEMPWSEVGFRKVSEFVFEIEVEDEVSQWNLMGILNLIDLVHPARYEAGLNDDKTQTSYGSIDNKPLSYGPYTLKSWIADVEFVLERRDDFFGAADWHFKTINGKINESQQSVINEFKAGNLDVAGVGGAAFSEFKDNPTLYLTPSNSFYRLDMSIERPASSSGKVSPLLKYEEFRKALYLAIDREDFATNIQPPSTPLLGYVSDIHKVSEEADEKYHESSQHAQVLEDLGLSPETKGYNATEAKRLFDVAYAKAVQEGTIKDGDVIKLEFTYYFTNANEGNDRIAAWLEGQFEEVFGTQKFDLIRDKVSALQTFNSRRAGGDFDLLFTGLSGGTFDVVFLYDFVYGQQRFHYGKGFEILNKEVVAEIPNLFDLLKAKPAASLTDNEKAFLEAVDNTGTFRGTFRDLSLLYSNTTAFSAEYEGRTEDISNMAAQLERVLLTEAISLPLFSSVGATVYSERVVIMAPEWQSFMGWGGFKYRYIAKTTK